MIEKIKNILGSVRFWQVLIAIVLLSLASYGLIPEELAKAIATLLGISVTIGTIDRSSEKIGGLTK